MASIVEVFGNCRVLEHIASGPLTDVYRAVQEPLGRHVAIKALRSTITPGSPFASHLAREGELLAKLKHENILALYDFVRTDSSMWLVLEYVDGVSLADVLAKVERLSTQAALAVGLEIARALAHAHELGIIHRDIKPSNVLVSRRGEIKLVDFGIAHDDRVPSSPEPLEGGATFGTPAYMSPEQILGEPLDGRTDIFSLGVVLYQLVAGVRPFDGPDTKTTAQRIRHSEPHSLVADPVDTPRAIERVVMRCIEKLPGDRFANARELLASLEALLRAETTIPTSDLISTELLRAKIIDQAPTSRRSAQMSLVLDPARASLWPAVRGFFALLVLAIAGGVFIQRQAHDAEAETSGKQGPLELVPSRSGFLRVVARPWAEVVVDGQHVDVTPFARSIPLSGGTHYVTFKHPKAADERRVIKITPGETVMLDVNMSVKGFTIVDA
ncbi:MAG TPA: serine/threonine-protein kinase, partial [Polyangiaceae bacterium]|nr:serine/threonine-protein kinase [Polyangiaceae bacterium]